MGVINHKALYKYYQPNKKDIKDEYEDCVIRALTKVLDKTWLEVFDELVVVAREIQCHPNNKLCYETFLKQKGFVYHGISNKRGTTRPTVATFTDSHKKGTYFVTVANHVVAVVDGQYFDTWDSGWKSMYGYWEKG